MSAEHRPNGQVDIAAKVTQIRRCFNIGEVMAFSGERAIAARCRRRALQLGGEIVSLVDGNTHYEDALDSALAQLQGTDAEMYKNVTKIIDKAQKAKQDK